MKSTKRRFLPLVALSILFIELFTCGASYAAAQITQEGYVDLKIEEALELVGESAYNDSYRDALFIPGLGKFDLRFYGSPRKINLSTFYNFRFGVAYIRLGI